MITRYRWVIIQTNCYVTMHAFRTLFTFPNNHNSHNKLKSRCQFRFVYFKCLKIIYKMKRLNQIIINDLYNEFWVSSTTRWKKVIMPSNLFTWHYFVKYYSFAWQCNCLHIIHSRNMQFKLFDVKINIDMRNTNMDTPFLENSMFGHLYLCFKLYLAENNCFLQEKIRNIISYDKFRH